MAVVAGLGRSSSLFIIKLITTLYTPWYARRMLANVADILRDALVAVCGVCFTRFTLYHVHVEPLYLTTHTADLLT